jgi:hypothetical protein
LSQSILLTLVCPFIHVESDFPFDLQHVAGRMSRKYGVKSIQIDLSEATVIDVPGNQNSAFAVCGRACKDTRTRYLAVTGLKVGSGNFP